MQEQLHSVQVQRCSPGRNHPLIPELIPSTLVKSRGQVFFFPSSYSKYSYSSIQRPRVAFDISCCPGGDKFGVYHTCAQSAADRASFPMEGWLREEALSALGDPGVPLCWAQSGFGAWGVEFGVWGLGFGPCHCPTLHFSLSLQ